MTLQWIGAAVSVMLVYLGSKRGVTRGVEPIIEDSSILLAGVTNGFLLDLKSDRDTRTILLGC